MSSPRGCASFNHFFSKYFINPSFSKEVIGTSDSSLRFENKEGILTNAEDKLREVGFEIERLFLGSPNRNGTLESCFMKYWLNIIPQQRLRRAES